MMVRLERKPSELVKYLYEQVGGEYFYDRVDLHLDPEQPAQRDEAFRRVTAAHPERIAGIRILRRDDTDGFKFCMEDGGWMLIRFSGTEPVIRVYCETTHGDKVRKILDDGVGIVGLKNS
jgi:phosphomannomutase